VTAHCQPHVAVHLTNPEEYESEASWLLVTA
jgi:hypothetical protein